MMIKFFLAVSIVLVPLLAGHTYASEAFSAGEIKQVRYRSEYINFKVISTNSSGASVNGCEQCGPDVSKYAGGGFCYIHKDKKNLISLFLSSYAMGKTTGGRISSWDDCNVYEFHLYD